MFMLVNSDDFICVIVWNLLTNKRSTQVQT